ncbi:MAG: hypothetical protein LBN25_01690, partial [Christensenellaceae bacterium]|nr:hypothetical protein [Christensenellaceae bacterium]
NNTVKTAGGALSLRGAIAVINGSAYLGDLYMNGMSAVIQVSNSYLTVGGNVLIKKNAGGNSGTAISFIDEASSVGKVYRSETGEKIKATFLPSYCAIVDNYNVVNYKASVYIAGNARIVGFIAGTQFNDKDNFFYNQSNSPIYLLSFTDNAMFYDIVKDRSTSWEEEVKVTASAFEGSRTIVIIKAGGNAHLIASFAVQVFDATVKVFGNANIDSGVHKAFAFTEMVAAASNNELLHEGTRVDYFTNVTFDLTGGVVQSSYAIRYEDVTGWANDPYNTDDRIMNFESTVLNNTYLYGTAFDQYYVPSGLSSDFKAMYATLKGGTINSAARTFTYNQNGGQLLNNALFTIGDYLTNSNSRSDSTTLAMGDYEAWIGKEGSPTQADEKQFRAIGGNYKSDFAYDEFGLERTIYEDQGGIQVKVGTERYYRVETREKILVKNNVGSVSVFGAGSNNLYTWSDWEMVDVVYYRNIDKPSVEYGAEIGVQWVLALYSDDMAPKEFMSALSVYSNEIIHYYLVDELYDRLLGSLFGTWKPKLLERTAIVSVENARITMLNGLIKSESNRTINVSANQAEIQILGGRVEQGMLRKSMYSNFYDNDYYPNYSFPEDSSASAIRLFEKETAITDGYYRGYIIVSGLASVQGIIHSTQNRTNIKLDGASFTRGGIVTSAQHYNNPYFTWNFVTEIYTDSRIDICGYATLIRPNYSSFEVNPIKAGSTGDYDNISSGEYFLSDNNYVTNSSSADIYIYGNAEIVGTVAIHRAPKTIYLYENAKIVLPYDISRAIMAKDAECSFEMRGNAVITDYRAQYYDEEFDTASILYTDETGTYYRNYTYVNYASGDMYNWREYIKFDGITPNTYGIILTRDISKYDYGYEQNFVSSDKSEYTTVIVSENQDDYFTYTHYRAPGFSPLNVYIWEGNISNVRRANESDAHSFTVDSAFFSTAADDYLIDGEEIVLSICSNGDIALDPENRSDITQVGVFYIKDDNMAGDIAADGYEFAYREVPVILTFDKYGTLKKVVLTNAMAKGFAIEAFDGVEIYQPLSSDSEGRTWFTRVFYDTSSSNFYDIVNRYRYEFDLRPAAIDTEIAKLPNGEYDTEQTYNNGLLQRLWQFIQLREEKLNPINIFENAQAAKEEDYELIRSDTDAPTISRSRWGSAIVDTVRFTIKDNALIRANRSVLVNAIAQANLYGGTLDPIWGLKAIETDGVLNLEKTDVKGKVIDIYTPNELFIDAKKILETFDYDDLNGNGIFDADDPAELATKRDRIYNIQFSGTDVLPVDSAQTSIGRNIPGTAVKRLLIVNVESDGVERTYFDGIYYGGIGYSFQQHGSSSSKTIEGVLYYYPYDPAQNNNYSLGHTQLIDESKNVYFYSTIYFTSNYELIQTDYSNEKIMEKPAIIPSTRYIFVDHGGSAHTLWVHLLHGAEIDDPETPEVGDTKIAPDGTSTWLSHGWTYGFNAEYTTDRFVTGDTITINRETQKSEIYWYGGFSLTPNSISTSSNKFLMPFSDVKIKISWVSADDLVVTEEGRYSAVDTPLQPDSFVTINPNDKSNIGQAFDYWSVEQVLVLDNAVHPSFVWTRADGFKTVSVKNDDTGEITQREMTVEEKALVQGYINSLKAGIETGVNYGGVAGQRYFQLPGRLPDDEREDPSAELVIVRTKAHFKFVPLSVYLADENTGFYPHEFNYANYTGVSDADINRTFMLLPGTGGLVYNQLIEMSGINLRHSAGLDLDYFNVYYSNGGSKDALFKTVKVNNPVYDADGNNTSTYQFNMPAQSVYIEAVYKQHAFTTKYVFGGVINGDTAFENAVTAQGISRFFPTETGVLNAEKSVVLTTAPYSQYLRVSDISVTNTTPTATQLTQKLSNTSYKTGMSDSVITVTLEKLPFTIGALEAVKVYSKADSGETPVSRLTIDELYRRNTGDSLEKGTWLLISYYEGSIQTYANGDTETGVGSGRILKGFEITDASGNVIETLLLEDSSASAPDEWRSDVGEGDPSGAIRFAMYEMPAINHINIKPVYELKSFMFTVKEVYPADSANAAPSTSRTYKYRDNVTFTTPNRESIGLQFTSYTGDRTDNSAFLMPAAYTEVVINYAWIDRTAVTQTAFRPTSFPSLIDGGSIYHYGQTVNLFTKEYLNGTVHYADLFPANDGLGYEVVGFEVRRTDTNALIQTVTDGSFVMPNLDVTVSPVFDKHWYDVTFADKNGLFIGAPSGRYADGSRRVAGSTIAISPDVSQYTVGYEVKSWNVEYYGYVTRQVPNPSFDELSAEHPTDNPRYLTEEEYGLVNTSTVNFANGSFIMSAYDVKFYPVYGQINYTFTLSGSHSFANRAEVTVNGQEKFAVNGVISGVHYNDVISVTIYDSEFKRFVLMQGSETIAEIPYEVVVEGITYDATYSFNMNAANMTLRGIFDESPINIMYYLALPDEDEATAATLVQNILNPFIITTDTLSQPLLIRSPSRVGYDFAGWTETSGQIEVNGDNEMWLTYIAGKKSYAFVAHWTPIHYSITVSGVTMTDGAYAIEGGTYMPPAYYTVNDGTIVIPYPHREGYTLSNITANLPATVNAASRSVIIEPGV